MTEIRKENPFYVGGPVPHKCFIGREAEVNTAFDQIFNRSHLAIWGSSGIGKSSFLHFIAEPQTWKDRNYDLSKVFIVLLNCTGIHPFTPSAFWREVLSLLKYKADDNTSLQSQIEEALQQSKITKADIQQVLRKIGQHDKLLVLLLDDYDAALCPNENYSEGEMLTFLSEFRNLAVNGEESRYLSTIVTSFRRLNELGPKIMPSSSPWYNHYLFQPLKPFTENDIASWFYLQDRIPQDLRDGVHEIAARHPALLQNSYYLLHNSLRIKQIPNVEEFVKDFQSATEHIFRNSWVLSSEDEQILMMLIALSHLEGRLNKKRSYDLGDIDIIFSQKSRELRDLEERGIIEYTVKQGKFVCFFTSSMMERWVIMEIENSTPAKLAEREKVLLNLMSRKQAEKIKVVMLEVWKYKDALQSAVGWLGQLVGVLPT
jgi:hypothetical protein